jgi:tRNA/rRNA methyltransferase
LPSESKIGLVFGREDAGLTSEEVAQCSLAATVAASGELGSLNLSQATLLILYELSRQPQLPVAVAAAARELPEQKELDGLYRQIDEILERIAFINPSRPEAVRHRVRQLFNRIGPDKEEVAFLRGMWSQIASSVNDWVGRRRG